MKLSSLAARAGEAKEATKDNVQKLLWEGMRSELKQLQHTTNNLLQESTVGADGPGCAEDLDEVLDVKATLCPKCENDLLSIKGLCEDQDGVRESKYCPLCHIRYRSTASGLVRTRS